MILIKQSNKRSTKRLQIMYLFLHKHLLFYKKNTKWVSKNSRNINGSLYPKHQKFWQKKESRRVNTSFYFKNPVFIINYGNYITKPREFVLVKNIYNHLNIFPTAAAFYPGFKLYPRGFLSQVENIKKLVGQFLPLIWIPINMPLSSLFNVQNNKNTYLKSSGAKGFKKRFNRQAKLINVLLPSGTTKTFPTHTYTLFTSSYNLYFNKVVEGSWGYYSKNRKIINVRGVAKNPVDHPNGGRTKAKQPELSPWGWIAKLNK